MKLMRDGYLVNNDSIVSVLVEGNWLILVDKNGNPKYYVSGYGLKIKVRDD